MEDLTGIFFIPAMLNKSTSSLLPAIEDNKLAWFPREILKPMIEPELAIGDGKIYDEVVSDGIYNIYKIANWQEYIDYCKNIYEKTTTNLKVFLNENEQFEKSIINIDVIESFYANKTGKNNSLIREIEQKIEKINQYLQQFICEMRKLKKYNIDDSKIISNKDELDIWLDTNVRYISFWLAVHYYEARWLEGDYSVTDNQKGTTFENVLKKFYKRLSMIMPCMVMTFYMLPKQFEPYNIEGNEQYLYNIIDTLIVDEAGQVSTEIGACSFSLAKKAIVVGDEKQIESVWGVERALDKSLAIQEKVNMNLKEFKRNY